MNGTIARARTAGKANVLFTATAPQEENVAVVTDRNEEQTKLDKVLLARKLGAAMMMGLAFRETVDFVEDIRESPDLIDANELYVTPLFEGPMLRVVVEPVPDDQFPRWLEEGETVQEGDEIPAKLVDVFWEWRAVPPIWVGSPAKRKQVRRRRPRAASAT